ncbi:MAG: CoA pyrophosphatase [Chloroflexota bacterium]|nr:CoA pyrophosphatase [Chloroflexota bacterium]
MLTCLRFAPAPPPSGSAWTRRELTHPPAGAVESAVLLPLVVSGAEVRLLLTERGSGLRYHAGELSLPGGRVEAADASWQDAALRETGEELGLPRDAVEVLGRLDGLYVPPSNFWIVPFVGLVLDPAAVRPSPREVQSVVEAPLSCLFDPSFVGSERVGGRMVDCYRWEGHRIWGATARILNNLAEVMGLPCEDWHKTWQSKGPPE